MWHHNTNLRHNGILEIHLAADDDCMIFMGQAIHRLETDGVDFVVHV
jgi:hypothetical protein